MSTAPDVDLRGPGGRPARRDLGWFLAVGFAAAAARLAFAWQYTRHPLGWFPWVDEASYWTWAQALARGGWLPVRPFYQDPLYPYALALLMKLVGGEPVALRLASAALGTMTPLLVMWAGRRGLGRAEGIAAGVLAALYGPLVLADGSLEKEGLGAACAALALGLTARSMTAARPGGLAALSGFAWGLVALVRANALVVAPVGAACWLAPPGRRPASALSFLLGFALALAPVVGANVALSRRAEFFGTTWQAGANFYLGNGPEATGTYAALPFVRANPAYEAGDFAREASRRAGRALSPGEVSSFWFREGLRRWWDEPAASARMFAWKLALVAHQFEVPDNQDADFVRLVAAPALGWAPVGFGTLLPLAALGMARPRPERTRFWWFLTGSTALGLVSTAAFFVVGRYRVPWAPGLALLAAGGAADAARRAAAGDARGLIVRLACFALPAALLAWWPRPDPAPARWGRNLMVLGLAEIRAGRPDEATDAFDLARASSAAQASYVNEVAAAEPVLGLLRQAAGDVDVGGDDDVLIRQARRLRQVPDRRAEAEALLGRVLARDPDQPRALRERGALWLCRSVSSPDRRRARRDLERAARRDPTAALLLALLARDPGPLSRPPLAPDPAARRMAAVVAEALRGRIP